MKVATFFDSPTVRSCSSAPGTRWMDSFIRSVLCPISFSKRVTPRARRRISDVRMLS